MPIYEYRCGECQHRFELIVSASTRPACPECGAERLEKQLSVFAVAHGQASAAGSHAGGACGTCGDPRGPGACALD